ncbi:ROK family protein [Streptomyces alkaliphilus]|uniref:ROK family protein n=1 Tax=Streptomyces alkaliphilus TaxID=1472722 RepID=A0A7W3TDF2_9ACTN|nr:ROK family protein [Streptomyces alkaliphilus]MBB0244816.1 ROK family protein [Streptomyces alkaliphilus]
MDTAGTTDAESPGGPVDTGSPRNGGGAANAGRPAPALALDIGGTKFAAAVVEHDGTITARTEEPLTGPGTAAGALRTVIARVLDRVPGGVPSGVGIGSAGPLDPIAGTVSPVNIREWREHPLRDEVAAMFPGRPVRLAGDGQCMALGEWWRAPDRDRVRSLLGVVVSTGVGGGLALDGRAHAGSSGNAGHIGHTVVDPAGERCPCGATGCVETIASGPSMVRRARAAGWSGADARELAAAARAGEPRALAAFDEAGRALALALLNAVAVLDPDRVVIGGGVAAAGGILLDPLYRWLDDLAGLPFLRGLRPVPTALGRDAGLYGAAALIHRDRPAASLVAPDA